MVKHKHIKVNTHRRKNINQFDLGGDTMLPGAIGIYETLKTLGRAAKRRIYRTVTPLNYNIKKAAKEFISGKTRNMNAVTPAGNEEWARYLGVPYKGATNFEPAIYKPAMGKTYPTVLKFKDESLILSNDVLKQLIEHKKKTGKNTMVIPGNGAGLGSYTVSLGVDENGKPYASYYDDWDINPFKGINAAANIPIISNIEDIVPTSNPFTVYGRRYYTDDDLKANGGPIVRIFKGGGDTDNSTTIWNILPEVTVIGKRKNKHGLGGSLFSGGGYVREINNNPIAFDAEGNLVDLVTGEKGHMQIPEITVRPTYLDLTTYYPLVSEYVPGHSVLTGVKLSGDGNGEGFMISKKPDHAGYNFVTNNCSDATREALEAATENKLSPYLFTTPGDVQDFFKELYPDYKVVKEGPRTILRAYVTPTEFDKAKEVSDSLVRANAEKRRQEAIERREKIFAEAARQRLHLNGGNLFEIGGPRRSRFVLPRPKLENREMDPEAYDRSRQYEIEQRALEAERKKEATARFLAERDEKIAARAREINRAKNVVMSALTDSAQATPVTENEYTEAANQQRLEKLDKASDYKKGIRATVKAAELGLSGASLLGAYANWKNWATAGNATQKVIANLLQKAQAPAQFGGTMIDGYQTYDAITRGDNADAWYNGISALLGASGFVGALDRFRGAYPMVDRFLDTSGIIQNAGDLTKFGYESIRDMFNKEKAFGGDISRNETTKYGEILDLIKDTLKAIKNASDNEESTLKNNHLLDKENSNWDNLSMHDKAAYIRMGVANGYKNIEDIKNVYNEFRNGGYLYGNGGNKAKKSNWVSLHQQQWYSFLRSKGVLDADAQRLSGFFAAQDALESGSGSSNAARTKNNYGGMLKGGKNISYASTRDYMEDKWRMMNSRFKNALSAKSIDEYATILGNPNTAGKGYLYYVTDKAKYDPKSPLWKAALTLLMHTYINGMRSLAGKSKVNFKPIDVPVNIAQTTKTNNYSDKPLITLNDKPTQKYIEYSEPVYPENSTFLLYEEPDINTLLALREINNPIEDQNKEFVLEDKSLYLPVKQKDIFLDLIPVPTIQRIEQPTIATATDLLNSRNTLLSQELENNIYNTAGYLDNLYSKYYNEKSANIFDGTTEPTQQMNNHEYFKPIDNLFVDAEGNVLDPNVPSAKGTVRLPDVVATRRDPRKPIPTAFDKNEDLLRPMMDFVPGVGDALQAKDAIEDARNGDYINAGVGASLLLLPNIIEKPLKYLGKGLKHIKNSIELKKLERQLSNITDKEWDDAYFAAINAGDMETVQQLRDLHFYVKSGHKPKVLYRGSKSKRNTYFRDDGSAVWFTPDYDAADFYRRMANTPESSVRSVYIKPGDKPLSVDGELSDWDMLDRDMVPEDVRLFIPENADNITTSDVVHYAKEAGYDQVDFKNVLDATSGSNINYPQTAIRKTNNIKLSDAITYDDAGNIIPLSKRDNFNNRDLRYGWVLPAIGLGGAGTAYGVYDDSSTNVKALGGPIVESAAHYYDGTTEDSQQMMNPYKPNGGFYYINSQGQPVNPTTRDIIELPNTVVAVDRNAANWAPRTKITDWGEDGFSRGTYEGLTPLVMSESEWNRSHSANDLQRIDPYGEIPWNAAAVATSFLAPELVYPYISKGAELLWRAGEKGLGVIANAADDAARYVSPSYDLYRTIGETTPRTTPTYHGFRLNGEQVYTGSPLFEFGQTMGTSPEKAYFMRAPKDVDVLKLGNGKFRHEVVGNNVLPSGEVNGKFVSYGEPWQEFALGENSALYEFPVGPRRGPSLMATDWKGRPQKYSVDEVYDYMQQEEALRKELASIEETMGDDFLKQYSTIRRNLINEKYPALKEHIDTSIYGANQTVIPNERWSFDKFLKTPFWKYSENPTSGQIQKELMMRWPEAKPLETPAIEWADAARTPQITAENAASMTPEQTALASLNSDINPKLPMAVKALKANKQAVQDIAEMNKYHAANVAEYNKATGSNSTSIPFRTDITGSQIKVLPDEEFNAAMRGKKTNSPNGNVENIGGLYSGIDDTTYLRVKGNPSTAYHEFLHRHRYGTTNPEVTRWRIDQLVDPERVKNLSPQLKQYYLSETEFPVHLRQQGESMGIKVGQEFPGEEAFDELLFNNGRSGASLYAKGMDLDSPIEDKKLVWKALNGTLFGQIIPIIGLGTAGALYGKQE